MATIFDRMNRNLASIAEKQEIAAQLAELQAQYEDLPDFTGKITDYQLAVALTDLDRRLVRLYDLLGFEED